MIVSLWPFTKKSQSSVSVFDAEWMWWKVTFNRSKKGGCRKTLTFARPSRQTWLFFPAWHFRQILKLLPTQAAPSVCIVLTFIFTVFFFPFFCSWYSTIWARTRIRYWRSMGWRDSDLQEINCLEEKENEVEETKISAQLLSWYPPPSSGFAFQKSSEGFHFIICFCLFPFLIHCNLFQYLTSNELSLMECILSKKWIVIWKTFLCVL